MQVAQKSHKIKTDKFEEKLLACKQELKKCVLLMIPTRLGQRPPFHHLENIHEYNVLRCKKYDYRTLTANSLLAHKNSHKHDRKKLKSSMKPKRNADNTQWNFGSKKGCRKLVNFFSEKF